MSFLYPRTIAVYRETQNSSAGIQPYGGTNFTTQKTIARGISAHIQADRQGGVPGAKLAADAAGQSIWKVIFKACTGLVRDRDFITDDLGRKFQVISADPGSLVTTCRCQILET